MGERSLRTRLRALERTAEGVTDQDEYQLLVLRVDADSRVIDDGTEAARPWVGRLASEVPGTVVKRLAGVSMADL